MDSWRHQFHVKKWKISELSSSYVECGGKDTPVGKHISNSTRFLLNSRNRFSPHNLSKIPALNNENRGAEKGINRSILFGHSMVITRGAKTFSTSLQNLTQPRLWWDSKMFKNFYCRHNYADMLNQSPNSDHWHCSHKTMSPIIHIIRWLLNLLDIHQNKTSFIFDCTIVDMKYISSTWWYLQDSKKTQAISSVCILLSWWLSWLRACFLQQSTNS